MDLNEQIKGLLLGQAQPGSFTDKAGLALSQAGQTIAKDAGAGAAIMNDPRNSWIGMNPLGRAVSGGLGLGGALLGQIAYHGSPHLFEKFALSKVGTGEGAQAFGHGLYFAENPKVADTYRKVLSEESSPANDVAKHWLGQAKGDPIKAEQGLRLYAKEAGLPEEEIKPYLELIHKPKGALYQVDLPDEAMGKMMEWDKPLSEQPEAIRELLQKKLAETTSGPMAHMWKSMQARPDDPYAADFYQWLSFLHEGQDQASAELKRLGVPGIRYLDGVSREAGKGSSNYVVFDDALPVIKERTHGLGLAKEAP